MARLALSHRRRGLKENCGCSYCTRKKKLTAEMFWSNFHQRPAIHAQGRRELRSLEKL